MNDMRDYFDFYKSSNFIEEYSWMIKKKKRFFDFTRIQKCLKFNKAQPFFN